MSRRRLSWLSYALALGVAAGQAAGCEPKKDTVEPATIANKLDEAETFLGMARYLDAAETLEWVLEREPDNGHALGALALARLELGKPDEARALADKLGGSKDPKGLGHAAKVWAKLEDHAKAAATLATLADLRPDDPDVALALGVQLRKAGKLAEAEAALRRAAELDDHLQYVFSELGDVVRELERWDEALKLYMKGQALYKSDKRARAGAALVFEHQGKISAAADEWAAYIQLDCCSDYSNEVAKVKFDELRAKEQAALAE